MLGGEINQTEPNERQVSYYTRNGDPLPYDPWRSHAVPLEDVKAAADLQGVVFQQGDHLLLRLGFTHKFYGATAEEREVIVAGQGMQLFVFVSFLL